MFEKKIPLSGIYIKVQGLGFRVWGFMSPFKRVSEYRLSTIQILLHSNAPHIAWRSTAVSCVPLLCIVLHGLPPQYFRCRRWPYVIFLVWFLYVVTTFYDMHVPYIYVYVRTEQHIVSHASHHSKFHHLNPKPQSL